MDQADMWLSQMSIAAFTVIAEPVRVSSAVQIKWNGISIPLSRYAWPEMKNVDPGNDCQY